MLQKCKNAQCGAMDIPGDAKFCPRCGLEISTNSDKLPQQEKPEVVNYAENFVLIVMSIVGIVLIGCIIYAVANDS